MVREHGTYVEGIVSTPSPGLSEPDAVDYTSLKRSLSRTSRPSKPVPVPFSHGWHNHESRPHKVPSPAGSLHIDLPTPSMAADTALAALQHLPTPLLVLSSLKTVVLANDAMGRLLGMGETCAQEVMARSSVTEILRGQTLSQIGIDMVSDGVPIWVSWEKFLDNLASAIEDDSDDSNDTPGLAVINSGETTPVAAPDGYMSASSHPKRTSRQNKSLTEDTVVDVIVSSQVIQSPKHSHHKHAKHHKTRSPTIQATCRMIISIWTSADQIYFTLTFTSAPAQHSRHSSNKNGSTQSSVGPAKSVASNASTRSSHSHTPSSSRSSSAVTSPSEIAHTTSAFPPVGTISKAVAPASVTDFQKVTRMKDAMLTAMEIPVLAMWRDESVVFPNQAARRLLAVTADPTSDDSYDFMSRFRPYTAGFERELDEHENPIIRLCRTQKAFTRWQIGLINEKTGKRSNYDVSGHPVIDENTGEFFAGLIAFKDVTEYTEKIANQTAENEQQFQLICDTMPQMLWTTRPDGYHDYFSQRWYDYTGLGVDECMGLGWQLPFHEDDMPETGRRWTHSLATGDEYLTEYRCRRYDGEWRWMLGRALPLRDSKTGKIVKWFGTCTDIQDIVDARHASQAAQKQLVDVLKHAQMTMWIIDREGILTFFEGDIQVEGVDAEAFKSSIIGKPAATAFDNFVNKDAFSKAVRRILDGLSELELLEVKELDGKHYRLRIVAQRGESGPNGIMDPTSVIGVAGISMDVTHLKKQEQENVKLLANESAAKEASKMKSNFLANMSHEIRTPIAGVLGMSELLMDTNLDPEQSDFAQNIQRSANSLLTVINDILDFSKIESGRLDIEEVQFSLSVVLKDVAKMLSYAARRKNLEFSSDLQLGATGDLALLGDPGRIRQILTNLLTNSIKFTSDGFVKLTVRILDDKPDSTTVEFEVEDTGIGIEEEVKKRLFRPFSQADSSTARRFGGTGLGLTISKNLVDLMHGEIKLESKLDCGTKATFKIPFKKPEFAPGTSAPLVELGALPDRLHSEVSLSCNNSSVDDGRAKRPSPPLHSPQSMTSIKAHRASHAPTEMSTVQQFQREKHHILVVEDNPVNQQIATRFIRSLKFSVSAVWNGREALEYLLKATDPHRSPKQAAECPIPSLILMDCQMPVLDGYHTTHVLRHHSPYTTIEAINTTPIVAMTASAIQGDRERCERAGMDDYLAKPVKRPVLEKMIMKWLDKKVELRPQLEQRTSSGNSEASLKPTLSRAGTDHSSTCAEIDSIVLETLRDQTSAPIPSIVKRPLLATLPSVQQQRRSSLSRTLLASEIPGGESEAEISFRRERYEEQATSLRDAKLLAATEGGITHGKGSTESIKQIPMVDLAAGTGNEPIASSTAEFYNANASSPLPRSYPDQGKSENGDIVPLTEENVERLNRDQGLAQSPSPGLRNQIKGPDGYFGDQNLVPIPTSEHVTKLHDDQDSDPESEEHNEQSNVRPISAANLPGPPPEIASSAREYTVPADVAEMLSIKQQAKMALTRPEILRANGRSTTRDSAMSTVFSQTGTDRKRKTSDWSNSNSTVRPEN